MQPSEYATIVSIVPREINEVNPHVNPGRFVIPAAEEGDYNILHVGPAIDMVYASEGRHIERTILGSEIAEDVVNGYTSSQIYSGATSKPGVFAVSGKLSKHEIKEKHQDKLLLARMNQFRWFNNLVKNADDSWSKVRQHGVISDLARDAAKALKVKKEWTIEISHSSDNFCPACAAKLLNADVTICKECRTIIRPEEHAKRFGVKVA